MKWRTRGSRWVWVAGLMALFGLACGNRAPVTTKPEDKPAQGADEATGSSVEREDSGSEQTGNVVGGTVKLEVPEVKVPVGFEVKLDGNLVAVVRAFREGGEVAVAAMVRSGNVQMEMHRLRVGVTVTDTEQVTEVKKKIEGLGGEVTVELGNKVFALLPVASLEALAKEDTVWNMEVPKTIASPFKGQ